MILGMFGQMKVNFYFQMLMTEKRYRYFMIDI